MDATQVKLAEEIDRWTRVVVANGGDEALLENMIDGMRLLKPLLETCSEEELTLLAQQYDGFYHFMQLLERLAGAIQDGVIDVPQDVPIPPDWPEKPQRPR